MKTMEILIEGDMPEICWKCDYCQCIDGGAVQCIPLHGFPGYDARRNDCPLIAWQSSESAPRDFAELFLAKWEDEKSVSIMTIRRCIGEDRFVTEHGNSVNNNFKWRPLPKTHTDCE